MTVIQAYYKAEYKVYVHMPSMLKPIVVLADSLLQECEEPRDAQIVWYMGITLRALTRKVRTREIDFTNTQLCIIHVGTTDVKYGEYDVIIPRLHELITQIVRHNQIIKFVISSTGHLTPS